MRTLIMIAALGALLIAALVLGIRTWVGMGDVAMPWQGWLALVLGVVLTLGLGVALMGLVFYSSRHGHDDTQYFDRPDDASRSEEAPLESEGAQSHRDDENQP
jgi:cytoskeletal protein RodZ